MQGTSADGASRTTLEPRLPEAIEAPPKGSPRLSTPSLASQAVLTEPPVFLTLAEFRELQAGVRVPRYR